MPHLLQLIVEPGFFGSAPVRSALVAGGIVAVVSGIVGSFAVLRGQSYAGHALADISVTGGSASFLAGISPLWGFAGVGVLAAGVMDMIGVQRPRGRDLATGIVRGAGLGLGALFLYWDTTHTSTTGATITILFGSMFTISSSLIPVIVAFSALALGIVLVLYRPLLLSSAATELAAARGISVRLVGAACLIAIALTVSLSAMTIGAILSTALLIGPAATGLRLTSRPGLAMVWAALIGLAATWLGVLLAYDSFYWPPGRHGWPVSFFVVTLIFAVLSAQPPAGTPGAGVMGMFSGFMTSTWAVASIVAVVAGVVGFFVVLRGAAFVADAVPQGAFTGAAAASLLGVSTLLGVAVASLVGALGIGWLGRRGRRDVATALALVVMLGLGALFLSFSSEYAPEIYSLLFGEVLGVSATEIAPVAILGGLCVLATLALFRPLLLSSLMPELAEARGVRASRMELFFLIVLALATSMTLPVTGALLIFSLMIGPPAAARTVTDRPLPAMLLSVLIALVVVWLSIAAAYQTNWPVGFFVGALGAVCYAAGRGWAALRRRRAVPAGPAGHGPGDRGTGC